MLDYTQCVPCLYRSLCHLCSSVFLLRSVFDISTVTRNIISTTLPSCNARCTLCPFLTELHSSAVFLSNTVFLSNISQNFKHPDIMLLPYMCRPFLLLMPPVKIWLHPSISIYCPIMYLLCCCSYGTALSCL